MYKSTVQEFNHFNVELSIYDLFFSVQILDIDKGNNFARVHLGFILKVTDNKPGESIPFLRAIMESNNKEIQEGKFYFHLGDAYQRLNQTQQVQLIFVVKLQ